MSISKSHVLVKIFILWPFLATLIVIAGCASKDSKGRPTGKVYLLEVDAEINANMGEPVALDVVSAYDEQVVDTLETVPASDWFQSKDNYILQFKGNLFIFDKEFMPGHLVQLEYTTGIDKDAIANFVFANYKSPGEHRARVDETKIYIELNENDFAVLEK